MAKSLNHQQQEQEQLYQFKWKILQPKYSFGQLYQDTNSMDVNLQCGNRAMMFHKKVLAICSEYFKELLDKPANAYHKHPTLTLTDIPFHYVQYTWEFVYTGEVVVTLTSVVGLMVTMDKLGIKGVAVTNRQP